MASNTHGFNLFWSDLLASNKANQRTACLVGKKHNGVAAQTDGNRTFNPEKGEVSCSLNSMHCGRTSRQMFRTCEVIAYCKNLWGSACNVALVTPKLRLWLQLLLPVATGWLARKHLELHCRKCQPWIRNPAQFSSGPLAPACNSWRMFNALHEDCQQKEHPLPHQNQAKDIKQSYFQFLVKTNIIWSVDVCCRKCRTAKGQEIHELWICSCRVGRYGKNSNF